MSNNWIFVLTEYSNYNYGSVNETVEDLKKRLKWRIGLRTPNRNKLSENDEAVFYVTGDNNKYFFGKTKLNSAFMHEGDPIFGYVVLKYLEVFQDPIYIKPLINQINIRYLIDTFNRFSLKIFKLWL